jgi:nucleoside-triphosphatase THEP1
MDELGFMEAGADAFTRKVLTLLEGDLPVIASTKARTDVPFLCDVRSHPNCRVYAVTPEDFEELYTKLLPIVRSW